MIVKKGKNFLLAITGCSRYIPHRQFTRKAVLLSERGNKPCRCADFFAFQVRYMTSI